MNDELCFDDDKEMDERCSTSTEHFPVMNSKEVCVHETPGKTSLTKSHSDYVCNLCNKSFSRKRRLNDHMRIHDPKNPQVCQLCNKSFTYKGKLNQHLLTHSGEKPHVCEICHKRFTQKSSLKKHAMIHSGEKPHSCGICDKSFSVKENLKNHLLIHSGERPYMCKICFTLFRQKSNLNKHLLIHSRRDDTKNATLDRREELPSTSKDSKDVNSDARLSDTSENSHENKHTGKLKGIEEIYFIVKEEREVSGEEYANVDAGGMLIKIDNDSQKLSVNVKEENIHYELSDIIKEEHDIDYDVKL